jgi:uncharacterized membrane protein
LDIKDLNQPPTEPFSWVPDRFWWWWRASRVLQDYDLSGAPKEIIDEFPFFSYLLADLHPHVLAMPFGLLAMALALNLILDGGMGTLSWFRWRPKKRTLAWIAIMAVPLGIGLLLIGTQRVDIAITALSILLLSAALLIIFTLRSDLVRQGLMSILQGQGNTDSFVPRIEIGRTLHLNPAAFLLGAIVLGGMFFMNAWDFPVYVALFAGAYALNRVSRGGQTLAAAIPDFLWLGITLGVTGVVLYLPFYMSFSSQAGGPLPNLIFPTRGAHLWVMFAPLFLPVFAFLVYLVTRQDGSQRKWALRNGLVSTLVFGGLMLILALAMGAAIIMLPGLGDFYQNFLGSTDTGTVFRASLERRLTSPGGWLTLGALMTLALGALFGWEWFNIRMRRNPASEHEPRDSGSGTLISNPIPAPHIFTVLLVLLGVLLVFGVEFFYLRDQFGWRMNTIFKFYFQAWMLWSIAAAYGSIVLLRVLRGYWEVVFSLGLSLILAASLVYPFFSLFSKTNGFQTLERSLDSSVHLQREDPDSWAAIQWLKSAPPGVIAEAVPVTGGSYTNYARMATYSGKPNLLGWVGHESQWRGGGEAMGDRQRDLALLYCTRDWSEASQILDKYNIRYLVVGPLERSAYQPDPSYCPAGLVEAKFVRYLTPVFESGGVTIYEYLGENIGH